MIIRSMSGFSTSLDPTAASLAATLRPATFVAARRDDAAAEPAAAPRVAVPAQPVTPAPETAQPLRHRTAA
jgi:hypothetical protein